MFKSEKEYVPVVLKVMKNNGGKATIAQIRDYVEKHLHLSNDDKEEYPSAPMQRYTQIIRNLKSNKTLLKKGLATHVPGGFKITRKGLLSV
jgi:hypothetical protein